MPKWPRPVNVALIVDLSEESSLAKKYLDERQIKYALIQKTGKLDALLYKKLPTLIVYGKLYEGFDEIKRAVDIDEDLR